VIVTADQDVLDLARPVEGDGGIDPVRAIPVLVPVRHLHRGAEKQSNIMFGQQVDIRVHGTAVVDDHEVRHQHEDPGDDRHAQDQPEQSASPLGLLRDDLTHDGDPSRG